MGGLVRAGAGPVPFDAAEFAENPEERCACLLLLDTSRSMAGRPIAELSRGVEGFGRALASDPLARKRVEVGTVAFGPVRVASGFTTAESFVPPRLVADGDTPLGEAVLVGLAALRRRKDAYKANGIPYFRPWVFLVTDGSPTDDWGPAAREIREGEASGAFVFFGVGVEGADMGMLRRLCVRDPVRLQGLRFAEMFAWLSASLRSVSASRPGDEVMLAPPSGWAKV